MNTNGEMGATIGERQNLAGGYARGKDIYIPSADGSATVFMKTFHEIGHIIDAQFDLKEALRPTSEVKVATISFSPAEKSWLLDQSGKGWPESGVTAFHLSILRKLLKVVLKNAQKPTYDIHSVSQGKLEEVISEGGVGGSTIEDGKLVIVDHKEHRNVEFPADYVLELCFDVLNRSINETFGLPEATIIFSYSPDKRNQRADKIAKYVLKKGWRAPGHIFGKMKKE